MPCNGDVLCRGNREVAFPIWNRIDLIFCLDVAIFWLVSFYH